MFDIDKWQEIFSTIKKNKLRTFLTGFSVAWGIFMLMILLGSGNGLHNGVRMNFNRNAHNAMWMWSNETSMPWKGLKTGRPIRFTNDDFRTLKQIQGVETVSGRYFLPGNSTISYQTEYGSYRVVGVNPTFQEIENQIIDNGRYINDLDIKKQRKIIVIGDDIAEAIFKDQDPIGKFVKLNMIPFQVVGVYHRYQTTDNRQAFVPITTSQAVFNGGNRIHSFALTIAKVSKLESEAIENRVRETIAQKHRFNPEDRRALGSYNQLEEYIQTMNIFFGIKAFIWIIGFGTLIAGIVGVSNIMLIVVKERTKEIGIRKALGASPSSVVGLIILESVLITAVAGYIGLVFGVGIMEVVNIVVENMAQGAPSGGDRGGGTMFRNPTVDINIAIAATILLVVAGTLAGYIPARKAARIKPIEALRDE